MHLAISMFLQVATGSAALPRRYTCQDNRGFYGDQPTDLFLHRFLLPVCIQGIRPSPAVLLHVPSPPLEQNLSQHSRVQADLSRFPLDLPCIFCSHIVQLYLTCIAPEDAREEYETQYKQNERAVCTALEHDEERCWRKLKK
ncbi:hypothetical protein GOODEAATRI_002661 [Goodea atripinnis]|uniref:Secreted protein n=1 Tax=Goodea atripinnis TaxID=208336 RepID=A0ABV0PUU2_9TELE